MPANGSLESIGSVRAMHERANAETADNSDFGKFQRESKTLFEFFLPVPDRFFELREFLQEPHALPQIIRMKMDVYLLADADQNVLGDPHADHILQM